MINYLLLILLLSSFSYTKSQIIEFIFENKETNQTINNNYNPVVEYGIRVNKSNQIDWIKIEPKRKAFGRKAMESHNGSNYYIYEIPYNYNEQFSLDNKIFIDFKIKDNKNIFSGSQVLKWGFWDYNKINSDSFKNDNQEIKINTKEKKIYFKNSIFIKDTNYPQRIKVYLTSPIMVISGRVEDIDSSNDPPSKKLKFELSNNGSKDLLITNTNYNPYDGSFSIELRGKDSRIDQIQSNTNLNINYFLHFYHEDYFSTFHDVLSESILVGENQDNIEILMNKRNPYKPIVYEDDNSKELLTYDANCINYVCKDIEDTIENEEETQIYIKKINKCVDNCTGDMAGELNDSNEWVCVENIQLEQVKSKLTGSEKNTIDNKINECIEQELSTYYFKSAYKYKISKMCKERFLTNPDNNLFLDEFYENYKYKCDWSVNFINIVNNGLCNDNNINSVDNDYFFLTDLADAIYKNIRLTYNDNRSLELFTTNSYFINDFERLLIIFNRIDELEISLNEDNDLFRTNHYGEEIPDWIWLSKRADHYLQRIEFYEWYLETLYIISKGNNFSHKYSLDKIYNYQLLCINQNEDNKWKFLEEYEIDDFLKNYLIYEIEDAIDSYINYSRAAKDSDNYKPQTTYINNVREKVKKIINKRL